MCIANSHAYCYPYLDSYLHGHVHPYSNGNRNCYCYSYTYSEAYAHTDPYGYATSKPDTYTQAKLISHIISVTTGDALLTLGNITVPGYLVAKDLDGANYLTLGGDGTNYFDYLGGRSHVLHQLVTSTTMANQTTCSIRETALGQFAGELSEEPSLFHFQQRQCNPVSQRIAKSCLTRDWHFLTCCIYLPFLHRH